MLSLHDNFIANMYGPYFLALYAVVTFAVIILGWLAVKFADTTRFAAIPEVPQQPDPYAIAYLRGGDQEVIRLAVFNLLQRGYLTTDAKSFLKIPTGTNIEQSPTAPSSKDLSRIEKAVFDFAVNSRKPKEFFETGFVSVIKLFTGEYEIALAQQRLIASDRMRAVAKWILLIGIAVIIGLGGYKLFVAVSRGRHNVGFLIVIGIAGAIFHGFASRPRRISALGKRYIERLKSTFGSTQSKLAYAVTDPNDATAGLAVSIFGLAALGSTPMSDVKDLFRRSSSSHSGSSCGSGCGGGCGGGGCGGCGGG